MEAGSNASGVRAAVSEGARRETGAQQPTEKGTVSQTTHTARSQAIPRTLLVRRCPSASPSALLLSVVLSAVLVQLLLLLLLAARSAKTQTDQHAHTQPTQHAYTCRIERSKLRVSRVAPAPVPVLGSAACWLASERERRARANTGARDAHSHTDTLCL
jgi:hypothetical protein